MLPSLLASLTFDAVNYLLSKKILSLILYVISYLLSIILSLFIRGRKPSAPLRMFFIGRSEKQEENFRNRKYVETYNNLVFIYSASSITKWMIMKYKWIETNWRKVHFLTIIYNILSYHDLRTLCIIWAHILFPCKCCVLRGEVKCCKKKQNTLWDQIFLAFVKIEWFSSGARE